MQLLGAGVEGGWRWMEGGSRGGGLVCSSQVLAPTRITWHLLEVFTSTHVWRCFLWIPDAVVLFSSSVRRRRLPVTSMH